MTNAAAIFAQKPVPAASVHAAPLKEGELLRIYYLPAAQCFRIVRGTLAARLHLPWDKGTVPGDMAGIKRFIRAALSLLGEDEEPSEEDDCWLRYDTSSGDITVADVCIPSKSCTETGLVNGIRPPVDPYSNMTITALEKGWFRIMRGPLASRIEIHIPSPVRTKTFSKTLQLRLMMAAALMNIGEKPQPFSDSTSLLRYETSAGCLIVEDVPDEEIQTAIEKEKQAQQAAKAADDSRYACIPDPARRRAAKAADRKVRREKYKALMKAWVSLED